MKEPKALHFTLDDHFLAYILLISLPVFSSYQNCTYRLPEHQTVKTTNLAIVTVLRHTTAVYAPPADALFKLCDSKLTPPNTAKVNEVIAAGINIRYQVRVKETWLWQH